jgi:hypothetical protein
MCWNKRLLQFNTRDPLYTHQTQRQSLFWAQHLWSTRSQSTAFAFTNDWLSYILAMHSGVFRIQKNLVRFLFTCRRQLSFLWEAESSLTSVGDFLYFHTKLYWYTKNWFYRVFPNFGTNHFSTQETVYTSE